MGSPVRGTRIVDLRRRNPKAAKTLGIELKFALVARVDRVIQSWGKMSAGTKQTSELWRAAALRQKRSLGSTFSGEPDCSAGITNSLAIGRREGRGSTFRRCTKKDSTW